MASYLDKYRTGRLFWLVYYHKGDIKVEAGYRHGGYPYSKGTFTLRDRNTWLVRIPYYPMEVSSNGRVLVMYEEDIPEAKQMIRDFYVSKINTIENNSIRQLQNIRDMIIKQDKVTAGN